MVSKNSHYETPAGLPPMDESWWEAVLAEDEARNNAPHSRRPPYTLHNQHSPNLRPVVETPVVEWSRAVDLFDKDQPVTVSVAGCNRGGLLVNGEGLQGFVPISHLVETPPESLEPEEWLEHYHGRSLWVKIIECDPERGRVVFSERAALAEAGTRILLLQRLKPGDTISGVVTNITDFGVFVDLGGVEGLVHVSEISWGRVHHPTDALSIGEQVDVYVISIDRDRCRVALSLKRLHPNPWETAEQRYHPGQVTEAVITSIVPFGAFARLEASLDGLIHISEINWDGNPNSASQILKEGQHVKVRVLHVDGMRQRLGLSLRLDEPI